MIRGPTVGPYIESLVTTVYSTPELNIVKARKGKSSVAGVIQGQGVAVGPICVGRKSTDTERVLSENPNRSETQFENRNEYQKPANDEYIDGNYLLQNSKQVKKVRPIYSVC